MTYRPLCQPIITPAKRIAAERERNKKMLQSTVIDPAKIPITAATMSTETPWVLFQPVARAEGLDFLKYPSLEHGKRVYWRKSQ